MMKLSDRKLGIALSYANTILNMVVGIFLSSYLLRILGNTEYGIYQTITSFVNYLVLLEFGTGTVITRNLTLCMGKPNEEELIKKNVSTIIWITIFLSGLILIVSGVFYISIDTIYKNSFTPQQIIYSKQIFIFAGIYLLLSFFSHAIRGIILAKHQYTYSSIVSIIRIIIRTILLVVILFKSRYSIIIAFIDMVLGAIVLVCGIIFCYKVCKVKITLKHFDFEILKSSLPLCFAIFLQTIVNQANNNVDKFVIGIKLGPELVALYSVALYIYNIFSSLTTIPLSLYAPQIIKDVSDGIVGKDLTKKLVEPGRLVSIVGGAVLFGFISCGEQFVHLFYGENYTSAWFIAIIIMVPMYINMLTGPAVSILDAMNKRMSRSIILTITTVLNIILTVLWIDMYGIIGASVATAISVILGQIIMMNIYYSKVIKIKMFFLYKRVFSGILPYQFIGAVIALLIKTQISNIYLSFVVCGMVFLIVSFGGYILFGMEESEKSLLKSVLRKKGLS